MKKRVLIRGSVWAVMLCAVVLFAVPATAQTVPDFQTIMDNLQWKLDGVTVGKWTSQVWPHVTTSGTQPFAQKAAAFPGYDHTGNGIRDDHHLALLQKVLEGDACTRDLLGNTFVENVRNAFFANRANVMNRETKFTLRLLNDTRISINYIISANNRPAWTDPANQTITTGTSNNLRICVDSGIIFVGTTCLAENVDIPSLWGNDGLLNEGAPGLGEDLADLLAAYLTIGSQAKVDYMQALMYQTLARGVLGNVMELVLSLLGKGVPMEYEMEPWTAPWESEKVDKAYNPPNIGNHEIDNSYSPPLVVSQSDPYIAINRVRATVYGVSPGGGQPGMLEGVGQFWTNWYQIGANGFHGGFANRLTAGVKLNPGMPFANNYQAWLSSPTVQTFFNNTGCALDALTIASQPLQPATAISTSTYALSLQMQYPANYTYVWLSGASPGTLAPINPPVNSNVLNLSGLPIGARYYACQVSHLCTGTPVTSNTVSISYVPFAFTKHPPEQVYVTVDQNEVLTDLVEAVVYDESPVTYQWYRKLSGEPTFELYGTPSANGVLSFMPAAPTDAGLYFCRATSDDYGHSIDSNQMFVFATGVSLRIYDALAGLGPQGNLIVPSGSIAINTNANTLQTGSQTYFGETDAGVSVFRFHDVDVAAGVTVTVTGNRPLSITSAGDMRWFAPVTVAPGTLGGGAGGAGRLGGKTGGGGGSPGNIPGSGGTGGNAGAQPGEGQAGGWGGQGNPGTSGNAGNNGVAGESGLSGLDGALGYGSQGFAGTGGAAGQGGTAGTGGGEAGGGNPGYDNRGAGSAGAHRQPTTAGWNGAVGGGGGGGGNGHGGGNGLPGGQGGNASFQARSDDMTFAAGHGGGGGGGGGKGGGGKGGGAGGGGQGGGGGGGAGGITSDAGGWVCGWGGTVGYAGGGGGQGGNGGTGGGGGSALNAGDGGNGGAGGGAVIFAAKGVLRHATTTNVSASTRTLGTAGAAAQGGASGVIGGGGLSGTAGESGSRHAYQAYTTFCTSTLRWYVGDNASNAGTRRGGHGATGGGGGKGGDGGPSGSSGQGGDGGFGTPGMVKYMGSVAMTGATQIVAQNGASASPEHSGRGTLISNMNAGSVAGNLPQVAGHAVLGSLVGGDSAPLLRGLNPYLGLPTPLIGEMDSANGHAATRGWLESGYWNGYLVSPPFGVDTGLEYRILTAASSVFEGYDQLLIKNTNGSGTLQNVLVRVNGGPATPIGGTKYAAGSLAAGQTWTMSMPVGTTVLVGIAPVLNPMADDNTLMDGMVYGVTPTLADGTPVFSWSLLEGPAGMTIDANTGTVIWPATFSFGTPQAVTVQVENAVGADTVSWFVTVQPTPPVIDPITDQTTLDGLVYAYQATATGTVPLNWTLLNGPAGAAIDPFSGLVTWPATLASGTVSFEIQVEGPGANMDTASWDVTVIGAPPVIDPVSVPAQDELVEWLAGVEYTVLPVLLQGTPPNTWSLETGPAGAVVDENTGMLTWLAVYTPTPVAIGVRVENDYGQDVITWMLDVKAVPPVLVPIEDVGLRHGDVYSLTPALSSGSAPLTWSKVAGPATLIVDEFTGQVNWTADIAESPAVVTVRVENPEGDDEVSWIITVYPVLEFATQPQGLSAYTNGAPFVLSATWAGGQDVAVFEWFSRRQGFVVDTSYGVQPVTGNTVSLAVPPASLAPANYQFWVKVTDAGGEVLSTSAQVRIANPLTLVTGLDNQTLSPGDAFDWSISVTGGFSPLTYQWYASRSGDKADFVPVQDGPYGEGAYAGADTNTLSFTPFVPTMAGQYKVEVSDDYTAALVIGPVTLVTDYGVPAGGALSMALLCAATALGGVVTLKRRK